MDQPRPKDLYVAETVSQADTVALKNRGWTVVDVRVLPSKSDGDRADSVKKWLEGVRVGSIIADKDIIKIVELEARAYGLVGTKPTAVKTLEEAESDEDVIDLLLDFGKVKPKRPPRGRKRLEGQRHKSGHLKYRRITEPFKVRVDRKAREARGGHPLTAKFAPKSVTEYTEAAIDAMDSGIVSGGAA